MKICGCGAVLGQSNTSGNCRSCARKLLYQDPAARERMSKAKKRALKNPGKRARVAAAAAHTLREWHRTTDRDWSAWHKARCARLRSWCPQDRWQEYETLRLKVGASEARRIIEAEIPGTVEHARRTIASVTIGMLLKQERERAQAY